MIMNDPSDNSQLCSIHLLSLIFDFNNHPAVFDTFPSLSMRLNLKKNNGVSV